MVGSAWWARVEDVVERLSLLKHPFYRAWQEGRLVQEDLREYARRYYPHVAAFPRYVSATHSLCGDLKVRQMLLENLVEEERGPENHPELWLRFAEGLGMTREQVEGGPSAPETQACVGIFERLSREDALSGLSALYAYESQIPAVSVTKVEGLRRFYGISSPEATRFFDVHREADVWHSAQEREAIESMAVDGTSRGRVVKAAEESCRAVWGLLDGVCRSRGIACAN